MSDFKNFEKQAWENKARLYESTWGQVTTQVMLEILSCLPEKRPLSLLDIGCGPGELCAQAENLGVTATGADYSEKMLAIAKQKNPKINFVKEDAENLSFANSTFDVVTLNYLLLHVANPERALSDAIRVLKPAGLLVYSMWQAPENSEGLALIFSSLKKFADFSVIPPATDIFLFSDFKKAEIFLASNGLANIEHKIVPTFWEFADREDFFTGLQAGTRIGGLLDLQKAEVKDCIKQEMFSKLDKYKNDDSFRLPFPSIVVNAVKPAL